MLEFDHLAVSGETLGAARAYVEDALGVPLQPGGEHAVFHTHNALLGLEDGLYLEAIAVNPAAPEPTRPRWFDLDRFSGTPRLTNWICRAQELSDLEAKTGLDFGKAVDLQRGDLRWQMVVPDDGILPYDNCAPAIIRWQTQIHPATQLTQHGVKLRRLTIGHPQADALAAALSGMMSDGRIAFETGPAALGADFDTPHGPAELAL